MNIIWFLIFNCTAMPGENSVSGTNLAFHLEKSYKIEQVCLKDASKGAKKVPSNASCYFVCVKGFKGSK